MELRRLALTTHFKKFGFTPDADFPAVYGVVMDWDIGDATASVLSMRDGTASLYTTAAFGVIGGQMHERVRRAAVRFVKTAAQFAESGKRVATFDYPRSGQVFYYLLTYAGVRLVVSDELATVSGSDPANPLFAAAQKVLTELRLVSEKNNALNPGLVPGVPHE